MEDEGYTSPKDEKEVDIEDTSVSSSCLESKYPCHGGQVIKSWADLRSRYRRKDTLHRITSSNKTSYITDSHIISSAEFVDNIWKLFPVRSETGSHFFLMSTVNSSNQLFYISLPDFISNIIHLLNGRESQSFNYTRQDNNKFSRNPLILVNGLSPTVLDNYSEMFIQCGEIFRKLWNLTNTHVENNNNTTTNSLFNSFAKAVGDYLKIYQTVFMLKGKFMTSLTKLRFFVQPFWYQLDLLNHITDLAINENPVSLLSELNRLVLAHDMPASAELLKSLFITLASTYMRYISDWIFRGELGPPSEFHIRNKNDQVVRDRRFWTSQFSQTEQVPLFIEESIDLIFETGKAINLFNLIKTIDHSASSSLFSYDTDQVLNPCLSFDELLELQLKWNTKLDHFLTQYTHLTVEVNESISKVLSDSLKRVDVNFQMISQTRLSHQKSTGVPDAKLINSMKKQAKQREFYLTLQEQVEESKSIKSAENLRDKFEDEVNVAYNIRKEKEYDKEKKAFHKKYFSLKETVAQISLNVNTNQDENPHDEMKTERDSNLSLRQNWDSIIDNKNLVKLLGTPFVGCRSTTERVPKTSHGQVNQNLSLTPISNKKFGDKDEVDSPKRNVIFSDSKVVISRKRNYNKKKAKSIEEILLFKQFQKPQNLVLNPAEMMEKDEDERLDPDKLILTKSDPVPLFNLQIFNEKPTRLVYPSGNEDFVSSQQNQPEPSCMNLMFTQSVAIPLCVQHKMVNTALLHYFVKENKLFHHVALLNDFLMLQNGVFGHFLSTLLIEEVKKSNLKSMADLMKRTGRLNLVLNEALSIAFLQQDPNPLTNNLSFILVQEKDVLVKELVDLDTAKLNPHICSEFQILNALRLKYSVDWPLNILITDDMIHHFENLFGVFSQLLRSELLLERVFMYLKSKRSKSRQLMKLQLYRHKLLHFVRSLRFYMNVVVVHSAWTEFCASLYELDTLQKIYDQLVRYVREVSTNCFLSFSAKGSGILKLVVRNLVVIDSFCSELMRACSTSTFNWDTGSELKDVDFLSLRRKFAATEQFQKIFLTTLYKGSAKEAYPKIESFLELYDFNNFYQLLCVEFEMKPKVKANAKAPPPYLKTNSVPVCQSSKPNLNLDKANSTTASFYL